MNLRIVIAIVLFLFVGGLAMINPSGNFWNTVESPKAQCEAYDYEKLQHSTKLDHGIYNQAKLDRLLREPQNTFSNLAYIFAGLWILTYRDLIVRTVSLSLIFLGFGSGMYHASLLPEWRLIDILGVYAVLFALLLLAIYSVANLALSRSVQLYFCLCTVSLAVAAGIYRNSVRIFGLKILDSTYIVVGFVAIIFVLFTFHIVRSRENPVSTRIRNWTIVSLCTLTCILGGIGDRFGGFLANPNSLIQGHSIWHSFGGLSAALTTLMFLKSNDRHPKTPAWLPTTER